MAIGGVAPIVVAALLVTVRDHVDTANIALVFVIVVVSVAAAGGSFAGAMAAISSAVSFDFFLTRPYLHLRISSSDDVETTVLLLVVGLIVGNIAARARRSRRTAEATSGEIRRIYRVAELAAKGDEAEDVMLAAEAELTELLRLQSCRFEAPPFDRVAASGLERSGFDRGAGPRLPPPAPRGSSCRPRVSSCPSSAAARCSAGSCSSRHRDRVSRSSSGSWPWPSPTRSAPRSPRPSRDQGPTMADVVFIGIAAAFFAVCVLYVRGLDRMVRASAEPESPTGADR